MLKVKSLHWLLIFSLAMVFTSPATASSYKKIKAQLEKTYGVKVRFGVPQKWQNSQAVKYKIIPRRSRKKALTNLQKDFKKYRKNTVRHFIKEVYIFRDFSFDGARASGTYSINDSSLYVHESYIGNKEGVFHHELISVIWWHYPSNLRKLWLKLNPEGFEYAMEEASGPEMVENGNIDLRGYPEVWQQGFTCGYGTMSMEEDLNTFFEAYMANRKKLNRLAKQYPRIKKKMQLVARYLQLVEDHVEKLAQKKTAQNNY